MKKYLKDSGEACYVRYILQCPDQRPSVPPPPPPRQKKKVIRTQRIKKINVRILYKSKTAMFDPCRSVNRLEPNLRLDNNNNPWRKLRKCCDRKATEQHVIRGHRSCKSSKTPCYSMLRLAVWAVCLPSTMVRH